MTIPDLRCSPTTPAKPVPSCRACFIVFELLVALLLCFSQEVLAANSGAYQNKHEQPYALIFGTVWGPDDRPVYGAHLRMRRSNEKKFRWEAYSDHHGEFAFRVPPGRVEYVVVADVKGVKSQNGKELRAGEDVKVQIENDERTDIGVHLKY